MRTFILMVHMGGSKVLKKTANFSGMPPKLIPGRMNSGTWRLYARRHIFIHPHTFGEHTQTELKAKQIRCLLLAYAAAYISQPSGIWFFRRPRSFSLLVSVHGQTKTWHQIFRLFLQQLYWPSIATHGGSFSSGPPTSAPYLRWTAYPWFRQRATVAVNLLHPNTKGAGSLAHCKPVHSTLPQFQTH